MKRIYLIGDSISMHYGPYLRRYLEGVVDYARKEGEEEAPLALDHPQGANGGDSTMALAFLRAKQAAGGIDADALLLNCGLHDLRTDPTTGTKQVTLDLYRHNLEAIVELVRRMGLELIWIRTTPCDEQVHNRPDMQFHRYAADCQAYNAVADRVMAVARVPCIDLYGFTCLLGPDLYCDHVHFLEPIREKQAAFLAGWLSRWSQS